MDKQTLLDFISQHYEWRQPQPTRSLLTDAQKQKLQKNLKKLTSQDDWESNADTVSLVEEIEGMLEPKQNLTLPIELTKRKQMPQPCEDCDRMVSNRTVHKKILYSPRPHWRESCNVCRLTKNPETGKFDINFKSAQAFFISYLRRKD